MLLKDTDAFARDAHKRATEVVDIVNRLVPELSGRDEGARLLAAGKIYEIRQRYLLARAAYERVADDDRVADEALVRLAIVAQKLGDSRRSVVLAQTLVRRAPDFTFADIGGVQRSALTVLGDALRDNCDLEGAREAYEGALKLVPQDEHAAG
ncbi:MAG: hypothetical protein ACLGI6_22740, partial [Gammaproteobacteria bacterium]